MQSSTRLFRPFLAPYLIACCVLCASTAVAQQATLFPFLRGALSARSAGLGGSTVAMKEDAATTPLNPAALTTVPARTVSATFIKHVLDINAGMAIYADHWDSVGSFAATITYMNYGSFERTDAVGARLGTLGAADIVVGVSFAREIDTLISWGVTLKYMNSTLDDLASSAIAVDAGVLFQIPQARTNVALSILNVGTQLSTYDGIKDRLPIDVRLGVNHRLRGLPLMVNASLNHLADDVESFGSRFLNFSLGGEIYVGKYVQLRVGYDNSTRNLSGVNVSTQLTGVSGGIGVNLTTIDVDYALSTLGSSALLHRVSVAVVL